MPDGGGPNKTAIHSTWIAVPSAACCFYPYFTLRLRAHWPVSVFVNSTLGVLVLPFCATSKWICPGTS